MMLLLLLLFASFKKFVDNFPEQEKHRLIIPLLHVESFISIFFNQTVAVNWLTLVLSTWVSAFRAYTGGPLLRNQEAPIRAFFPSIWTQNRESGVSSYSNSIKAQPDKQEERTSNKVPSHAPPYPSVLFNLYFISTQLTSSQNTCFSLVSDMVVVFMYFFVFKETSQCGTLNNGCQHKCTNGACSCYSGYYLASNKKNCIAKDCNMPKPSYCAPGQ